MKYQGNRAPASVSQINRARSRFGIRIEIRPSYIYRRLYIDIYKIDDRNRSYQIAWEKSSDSGRSLQILGIESIIASLQECLEMKTCFLEDQFDRYYNIPKYAILSIEAILAIFNFKISTLIQDSGYQAIKT